MWQSSLKHPWKGVHYEISYCAVHKFSRDFLKASAQSWAPTLNFRLIGCWKISWVCFESKLWKFSPAFVDLKHHKYSIFIPRVIYSIKYHPFLQFVAHGKLRCIKRETKTSGMKRTGANGANWWKLLMNLFSLSFAIFFNYHDAIKSTPLFPVRTLCTC